LYSSDGDWVVPFISKVQRDIKLLNIPGPFIHPFHLKNHDWKEASSDMEKSLEAE